MKRYVKSLTQYLTEALNKAEWLNYKEDSALNSPNAEDGIGKIAALVQRMLNSDDPGKILFTGDDVSIAEDYKYFIEHIIPKSQKVEDGTYDDFGQTAFYSLYKNGEKFFLKFDIRDIYEYSYIFIREEDYDYFDKIDAPMVPNPNQQVQDIQRAQSQQAGPA